MDEDLIVTQMSLIFSQTRYIRMALDSLERSASRYAGVALGVAAGPHQWGAPPLEAGALQVFVVNIADLIPEEGLAEAGDLRPAFPIRRGPPYCSTAPAAAATSGEFPLRCLWLQDSPSRNATLPLPEIGPTLTPAMTASQRWV
jgi:hypothetical protein